LKNDHNTLYPVLVPKKHGELPETGILFLRRFYRVCSIWLNLSLYREISAPSGKTFFRRRGGDARSFPIWSRFTPAIVFGSFRLSGTTSIGAEHDREPESGRFGLLRYAFQRTFYQVSEGMKSLYSED